MCQRTSVVCFETTNDEMTNSSSRPLISIEMSGARIKKKEFSRFHYTSCFLNGFFLSLSHSPSWNMIVSLFNVDEFVFLFAWRNNISQSIKTKKKYIEIKNFMCFSLYTRRNSISYAIILFDSSLSYHQT